MMNNLNDHTPTVSDVEQKKRMKEDSIEKGKAESTSDDSGYNTDSGVNSSSEGVSSSASESFFLSDFSDEEEDVERRIAYLRAKQSLLQRASNALSREDAYDAANALANANWRQNDAPNPIWNEARGVLRRAYGCSHATAYLQGSQNLHSRSRGLKRVASSPKQETIDVSRVACVSSESYHSDDTNDSDGTELGGSLSSVSTSVFREGHWMAQALVSCTKRTQGNSNTIDSRWRVISDPHTCALGLLPPFGLSMEESVSLQEAITITEEPRLVTQPTPPFCVVHANKAFLVLAGLSTTRNVLGKPIETIVQVSQEAANENDGNKNARTLRSTLLLGENSKACCIRVVPVLDRSKRQRLLNKSHQHSACMSHVLVRVVPDTYSDSRVASSGKMTIAVIESKYQSTPPRENSVLGTVG
jgi:hypothetical protein